MGGPQGGLTPKAAEPFLQGETCKTTSSSYLFVDSLQISQVMTRGTRKEFVFVMFGCSLRHYQVCRFHFCWYIFCWRQQLVKAFVFYHFYCKTDKSTDTSGKFDSCRKTLEAFNWNFVKLHPRCCYKTWFEFQISVMVIRLVIHDLNLAF